MSHEADFFENAAGSGFSPAQEEPEPPGRVRSIGDLYRALSSGEMGSRLGALKAIQLQPQEALALGAYQSRDIIDILLTQAAGVSETVEWMSWVGTLSAFRNPRVTEFFLDLLANEESPQMLFRAGTYLASAVDLTLLCWQFLPLLLQNENPWRARAVAPLLVNSPFLTDAATLRIGLLSEEETAGKPPDFQSTSGLWMAELDGPFQSEAQIRLKAQGEAAWKGLAMAWSELNESNQLWLLEWGSKEYGAMIGGLIPGTLRSNSLEVRVEGLRALGMLQPGSVRNL